MNVVIEARLRAQFTQQPQTYVFAWGTGDKAVVVARKYSSGKHHVINELPARTGLEACTAVHKYIAGAGGEV